MINTDENGVLCHFRDNGSIDCGDGLGHTSHHDYLSDGNFDLYFFEIERGAYVRHPVPAMTDNGFGAYYESPRKGCISRDQLIPLLCDSIRRKDYWRMIEIVDHHKKNYLLFAYNSIDNGVDPKTAKHKIPDVTFMDVWALEFRGLEPRSFVDYVILNFLDSWNLLSVIWFNKTESKDPINLALKTITCFEHYPTLISRITFDLLDKKKLLNEIKGYCCGWRKLDGLFKLYEQKIKDLIK